MSQENLELLFFTGCIGLKLCAADAEVYAQQVDSAIHRELPSVTVFADAIDPYEVGSACIKLDSSLLSSQQGKNLADVLSQFTPAFFRNYGNGMLATISIRGMGAERTGILWNGFSIQYPSLGLADYSLVPAAAFNRIDVRPGASGALFGNSSQGGSVLLAYQPDWSNRFSLQSDLSYAMFETPYASASLSYGDSNVQGRSLYIRHSSTNNFSYRDLSKPGFQHTQLENASFVSHTAMQDIFIKLSKKWVFDVHFWWNDMYREIPAPMGGSHFHARQSDRNYRSSLGVQKDWKQVNLRFSAGHFLDMLNFKTDNFTGLSSVHTWQSQLEANVYKIRNLKLKLGANSQVFLADVDEFPSPIVEIRWALFALAAYEPKPRIRLSLGLRQQFVREVIPAPTASLGISVKAVQKSTVMQVVRAQIASAYRLPTLNDKFWSPGGNPDLEAEYGWNLELGTENHIHLKKITIRHQLTGYLGWVRNWIQWTPTDFGYWAPENLLQVKSAGIEFGSQLIFKSRKWNLGSNMVYGLTRVVQSTTTADEYQLIYVPQHRFNALLSGEFMGFYLQAGIQFTSELFIRTNNSQSLPQFIIGNLKAGKSLNLKKLILHPYVEVRNFANSSYQVIENRPMQGISVLAGALLNFRLIKTKNKQI